VKINFGIYLIIDFFIRKKRSLPSVAFKEGGNKQGIRYCGYILSSLHSVPLTFPQLGSLGLTAAVFVPLRG